MKHIIAAVILAAMTATASAKGAGHMPKLPKMGVPHAAKEKAEHEPKALKAKASKDPMSVFDDIGLGSSGGAEPMFAAQH